MTSIYTTVAIDTDDILEEIPSDDLIAELDSRDITHIMADWINDRHRDFLLGDTASIINAVRELVADAGLGGVVSQERLTG